MSGLRFGRIAAFAAVLCGFLALSPLASATPIGNISIGITPSGGVLGNNNLIDFYLPVGSGFGDFTTGSGTVTYSGGTLTAGTNTYGRIRDLAVTDFGALPLANFIQFYTSGTHNPGVAGSGTLQAFPTFSLVSVGPPAAVDCATNPGVNVPCSIHVATSAIGAYISPLVLTQNSLGGTGVRLDMVLNASDSTGSAFWTGLMTANVAGMTPAQIAAAINSGTTVNVTSWSADLTGVPEPSTMTLTLAGFVLAGIGVFRRRS